MQSFSNRLMAVAIGLGALSVPSVLSATPLDGLWRAQGYGFWLEIAGDHAQLDQVTGGGCVTLGRIGSTRQEGPRATLDHIVLSGTAQALGPLRGEVSLEGETLLLDLGKTLPIRFDRAAALPKSCATRPGSDALASFDMLWHGFQEHYAYFDLRGVDWAQARALNRPQITAETEPEALLDIFIDMLAPLLDGHVSLITEAGELSVQAKPAWAEDLEQGDLVGIVRQAFALHVPEGTRPHPTMGVGRTREGLGYLALIGFDGALVDGSVSMATILADLITSAPDMPALVIDLRVNFGGSDLAGYALAAQLTDRPVAIGSKSVWENGRWHADQPLQIAPGPAPRWQGPVYLLTSGMTISAAETFTLALSQFENVTLIGAPSNGVFSDVSVLALPNGWTATLSNERYLNTGGENFEARGVPVDIAVPLDPAEIAIGRDRAYEAVLAHLAGQGQ